MGRRILAIIVAAVLALIGGVMVLLYARNADARAVAAASPRTVFTSSLAIPAGTSIRDAIRLKMLTQTQVPAAGVPAGALTQVTDDNSALLALTDIAPGQYVLAASWGDSPVGEKLIQVPTGKLAVSVALSDPARVGSFVTPGSFITIFATHQAEAATSGDAAAAGPLASTNVLLDNIQVIGIGATPLQSGATPVAPTEDGEDPGAAQGGGASFLVTLAVTPEQATKLVHGINEFTLYAGLRGAEVKVDPKLETSTKNVFG
ncbi:Flp pilus assembly protein CpaB [Oryzobacter terrae]|uniref:Flp pilus assembly protein CpaB n=1 Tax=Oryzobacter terrae TaxID=1620385 RepID=UPI00366AE467